jgi:hypothetical protein
MVKTFVKFGMSVALGLALAMPFMRMPQVHAEELTADDLLDPSFGDQTGLGQGDLKSTVADLINVALGFLGVVAVVIILFGGFKWMVAGGNDEKVAEAKRLIIAGIIGLAIILSAYAIASFVIDSIVSATSSDNTL